MGLFNVSMALIGALDTDVLENEKLARHTSYRIGGPASLLVTCHSYHALRRAIETVNAEGVPWVVMGRGSNILVSDDGYRGVVIMLGREFGRTVIAEDGCTLTVGAATVLMRVVNDAYARGLSGLEFAVGIPGTLGGAINMDAGTRDEWIGSVVKSVMTYRPGTGICRYDHDQIAWGYRSCSLPAERSCSRRRSASRPHRSRTSVPRWIAISRGGAARSPWPRRRAARCSATLPMGARAN